MDNASFHHTDRIAQMCTEAGVKLIYLPPYSPDLNPIEEFFAELKAFIKKIKILRISKNFIFLYQSIVLNELNRFLQ